MLIGSAPVTNIDVISSRKLIAYTPRGVTGRQPVLMTNRYQQKAELPEETGFGYGLRPLAQATAALAHPTAVTVDHETGVAIATSGFFTEAFGRYDEELWELQHKDYNGVRFPDALRAVSYDVQGETHILQVGGGGNLPTGEEGQVRLARDAVRKTLEAKQLNEMIGMGEPLTLEEEEQLSKVAYENIATSLDSLSLQAVEEYEEGVQRKRLYVANGTAGISRLNLDEQNGMQLINEIGGNENQYLYTDLVKQGNSLFTAVTAASGMSKMVMPLCNGEGDWQGFRDAMHFSYINAADPVQLPDPALETGAAIALKGEWLLGGGVQGFS